MSYNNNSAHSGTEALDIDTNSIGGADYSLVTNRPAYSGASGSNTGDAKTPTGIYVTGITTQPSVLILKDVNGNDSTWTMTDAILPLWIPVQAEQIEFTGTTANIICHAIYS